MTESASYETDFHAWAIHNAELLRQGRLSDIDLEHIAEELESIAEILDEDWLPPS